MLCILDLFCSSFRYLLAVVKKYNLDGMIRLNSHVHSCIWEPKDKLWILRISCAGVERVIKAYYVVTASGPLHVPSYPNNIGVTSTGQSIFKGSAFHTAKWDHSVDLKDKRVAVIGTGGTVICCATNTPVGYL
jgi:cation diffusion facilitator CzcD-associated flavoprotein CzcO